jgi:hypothetical protein
MLDYGFRTSSHSNLEFPAAVGSTDVDVSDAPGKPEEYGDMFPTFSKHRKDMDNVEDIQGTDAFAFGCDVAASALTISFDFSELATLVS